MDTTRHSLERHLAGHGLRLRGGWIPTPADGLPTLPGGCAPAVVWLVGQVGSEVWPVFSASSCAQDGLPDPMDRWSKSIGDGLACTLGGMALYPSEGPPWHPFQRWASRSEPVQTSALMLQIHPQHGLWHAYRFALLLPVLAPADAATLSAPRAPVADLCAACDGQPCLRACPVGAFTGSGLRTDTCTAHLRGPQGAECLQGGCLSRRACPIGAGDRYAPEHAAFHMAAYFGARRSGQAAAPARTTELPSGGRT